jgi:hypothetical protein
MRYYSKFHDGCQTKNKAQAAALNFMKTFGSILLGSDDALDKMVADMQKGVDLINRTNPRCSDIDFRAHLHDDYRGKGLSVGEICSYSFYPVLSEFDVIEKPTAQKTEVIPEIEPVTFNF